ncbi:hypothetical protein DXG01_010120 [Tephrocybe rancida]|nr:hypothetical protein DXG01_010120 [Tephrocybe rancida]
MNDRRDSDPNLDLNSMNAPSRRASTSAQSSSTGRRYQDGSSRSSGRQSSFEEHSKALKQQLIVANKQLKGHELRAADSEQQLLALATQLKRVNDARIVAVQEAAKAKEELELYRIQLGLAHREIERAQRIIEEVDKERYDAEKAAAEARTEARKYHRDLLMIRAMDEGRKLGMQEGIEQGKALALREIGEYGYEDMNDEDYTKDYFDYTDDIDYRRRSRSLLLASNEDIVIHPPRSSTSGGSPPPPPAPAPAPTPQPIPVPPPEPVQLVPETRPRSFRSPSPSVHHQPIVIPPDGYIPTVDADNFIRIPPPHELIRPPPTPERTASPQLPQVVEDLRPPSRSHRRNQSTSSFASTSTHSNVAGPSGRNAPLSAILEVHSPQASPVPQSLDDHILRHQPSQYKKAGRELSKLKAFIDALLPVLMPLDLFVLRAQVKNAARAPPHPASQSRSLSSATQRSQRSAIHNQSTSGSVAGASRPTSMVSQLFGNRPISQQEQGPSQSGTFGGLPPSPHPTPKALPILMPGAYRGESDQTSQREYLRAGSSTGHRPLDDDASSIGSGLTTPQAGRSAHQRDSNLDFWTTPPAANHIATTGWEDALRNAGSSIPMQTYDTRNTINSSND